MVGLFYGGAQVCFLFLFLFLFFFFFFLATASQARDQPLAS